MGVNRDWMKQAHCAPKDKPRDTRGPWLVAKGDDVKIGDATYSGSTLIEYALLVCKNCPAQWECARFAVKTWPNWGTWACDISDLKWLTKQRPGFSIQLIKTAEATGTPVQVAVKVARRETLVAV